MPRSKKNPPKKNPWDNYYDEATPVHPELGPQHPMVVFNNHNLSAGKMTLVRLMPGPHMHSQIEINFILEGEITYWMDGKKVVFHNNTFNIFWGMVPHQVVHVAEPTHFVVLYVPIQMFLSLPYLSGFRDSIMAGAIVRSIQNYPFDRDVFLNWRQELLTENSFSREMVREELLLRLRRLGQGQLTLPPSFIQF